MKTRLLESIPKFLYKLLAILLIAFCGFTFGSVLFIEFGAMTWAAYWELARVFGFIVIAFIVARLGIEFVNSKKSEDAKSG